MAEQATFDVLEYRVLGNSTLPNAAIERAVYPYLGPGATIERVQQARAALEKAYHDAGYGTVFVDVPEQDVERIVRLKVTEGRLDRVRISGARYFSNGRIRESVPALKSGSVVRLPELQAQLTALNQQARDRQVTPVLRAGQAPGTVDIELKVKDELPLHAGVEVNNRYSADTSETRASINLSYDNLFQRYQSLSLQYQTAPERTDEVRVLAATYLASLPQSGNLLAFYAVDTSSNFATVGPIGLLSVLGAGRIYGSRYIVRLPYAGSLFHSMTFGADFKDFKDNLLQEDGTTDTTPIQYVNWSVSYGANARSQRSTTSVNFGANFGIRGLANTPGEFEFKRYKAKPNYFYLRGDAQHEHTLLWGTRLFTRLSGQFTAAPLISNEGFAIGGADSVRGYLEAEELGDNGLNGSIEFRSPFLGGWSHGAVRDLYLAAFYDAGVVGILDPLSEKDKPVISRIDLSSWGLGLRFEGLGGASAGLDWAYPLVSTDRVEAGDSRIHFQFRYEF